MERDERILPLFSKNIRAILKNLREDYQNVQEIRLRAGSPLFIIYKNREFFADPDGRLREGLEEDAVRYYVTREDVAETLECAARYSLYAFEEEMKQGFITVSGGHRIGVAGRVVMDRGAVKAIQPAASLNIRLSHEIKGCADGIIPYLYGRRTGELFHTLFISPPRCGKTTLLRDVVRQVSDGNRGLPGQNVGVVDERSEIGACYQGIPQNDVGCRTDVLDCCPKAAGMMMLIRSMAPSVVAVDEIGGQKDLEALRCVLNCGCKLLATIHGSSMEDLRRKPGLWEMVEERIFERYVILSSRSGPGTVEDICGEDGRSLRCG